VVVGGERGEFIYRSRGEVRATMRGEMRRERHAEKNEGKMVWTSRRRPFCTGKRAETRARRRLSLTMSCHELAEALALERRTRKRRRRGKVSCVGRLVVEGPMPLSRGRGLMRATITEKAFGSELKRYR
jgi:hypothetical protein